MSPCRKVLYQNHSFKIEFGNIAGKSKIESQNRYEHAPCTDTIALWSRMTSSSSRCILPQLNAKCLFAVEQIGRGHTETWTSLIRTHDLKLKINANEAWSTSEGNHNASPFALLSWEVCWNAQACILPSRNTIFLWAKMLLAEDKDFLKGSCFIFEGKEMNFVQSNDSWEPMYFSNSLLLKQNLFSSFCDQDITNSNPKMDYRRKVLSASQSHTTCFIHLPIWIDGIVLIDTLRNVPIKSHQTLKKIHK